MFQVVRAHPQRNHVITISCPPQAVTASSQPQHPTATATTGTTTATATSTTATHGHHQTVKAAAVAARDATRLKPLVHFFTCFVFFFLLH